MDRVQYWRNKYIKEHWIYLLIGLVICAAILFFIGRRAVIKLSPMGWALVSLLVVIVDVYNFTRRMNEYVSSMLMKDMEGGISTLPEDDPRFEDVE